MGGERREEMEGRVGDLPAVLSSMRLPCWEIDEAICSHPKSGWWVRRWREGENWLSSGLPPRSCILISS